MNTEQSFFKEAGLDAWSDDDQQQLEEARNTLCPRDSKGAWQAPRCGPVILTSGSSPQEHWEDTLLLILSHQLHGNLLQKPREANTLTKMNKYSLPTYNQSLYWPQSASPKFSILNQQIHQEYSGPLILVEFICARVLLHQLRITGVLKHRFCSLHPSWAAGACKVAAAFLSWLGGGNRLSVAASLPHASRQSHRPPKLLSLITRWLFFNFKWFLFFPL